MISGMSVVLPASPTRPGPAARLRGLAWPIATIAPAPAVPPLVNGDHLSQPEFHRRYAAMPSHVRAELIGGIVYMASPLRVSHGDQSRLLSGTLFVYQAATPGVAGGDNATAILGRDSEPQPDLHLRLLPECGGRTRVNDKQFLVGPPELVIEVAHSTIAIDLHAKKADYRRAGVREYLVLCIDERELRAFDLSADKAWPMPADGVFRSKMFSGLWIDAKAAVAGDVRALHKTAAKGVRSPEHKVFVKQMTAKLAPNKPAPNKPAPNKLAPNKLAPNKPATKKPPAGKRRKP